MPSPSRRPRIGTSSSNAILAVLSSFAQQLESLSRRAWFYLLIGLGPACLPPVTSSGLGYLRHLNDFITHVSETMLAFKSRYDPYLPALHIGVVLLFLLLAVFRDRLARLFALAAGIHFLFMLWAQAVAFTPRYGLVVLSEPALWYSITALLWFWEAIYPQTRYTFRAVKPSMLWLIPLALLAFWDPEQAGNYDPRLFLTSYSPTAFCMMVPIYLTVLRFQYPDVNWPLFRVTAFMGIVLGVVSLGITFFQPITESPHWLLIHSPLLIISTHCFLLGIKRQSPGSESSSQEQG